MSLKMGFLLASSVLPAERNLKKMKKNLTSLQCYLSSTRRRNTHHFNSRKRLPLPFFLQTLTLTTKLWKFLLIFLQLSKNRTVKRGLRNKYKGGETAPEKKTLSIKMQRHKST